MVLMSDWWVEKHWGRAFDPREWRAAAHVAQLQREIEKAAATGGWRSQPA